jgi:hypothetical protein
LRPA